MSSSTTAPQASFRPDLDNGNHVRVEVQGEVLRIIQRATHNRDRIRTLKGGGIQQPRTDGVQPRGGPLGNASALEAYQQSVPLRPIVDCLNHDTAGVRTRRSDGVDGAGFEVFALEAGAANLFGEKPVLNRMVDVLEELAVYPLVNRSDNPFGIDDQDATLESSATGAALER